jgi:drug/metabolite transporter (DMT)-like permease
MEETMREYLKRRQQWYVVIFVAGLALVLVPGILGRHNQYYPLLRLAGVLVLLGGSLLRSRVKCPKCDKPLGATGRWSTVPAFCPNCGVNFDEPMPHKIIS